MSDLPHMHRRRSDDVAPNVPAAPLTREQLDFFTHQTQRAVDKALGKYMRRAIFGFLILLIGFLFNAANNEAQWDSIRDASAEGREALVQSGDVIAVDGCNRDFQTIKAIRGVLLASAEFSRANYRSGLISKADLDERLKFYAEQLSGLSLPDCRETQGILTDDPEHPRAVPEPLYPDRDGANLTPPVSEEGGSG
jgi:hypothetical protein